MKSYIRSCDTCQRCKDNKATELVGKPKPFIPTCKGEIIGGDFYGPLQASVGGVKYIFVIIDSFTKFVKLCKVRSATMAAALRKLKLYVNDYGIPKSLYTDNGIQIIYKK